MGDGADSDVIVEQVAYYRARAPEYDQWWRREGRHDRGPEPTRLWFDEAAAIERVLDGLPIDGADVLELAAGTGIWTRQLARRAHHVTAVDASAEMITINRAQLGELAEKVSFIQADLFTWGPARRFDAIVFCFWISHVPDARLDDFLKQVAGWLRPDGLVFFLDAVKEPTSTAYDHHLPADGDELMVRRLNDGRTFRIVKNFWPATELTARWKHAGIDATVMQTPTYFQYGFGRLARTQ